VKTLFGPIGEKPLKKGDEAIIFLEDIPLHGTNESLIFGIQEKFSEDTTIKAMMKKIVRKGKIILTSEKGYYEIWDCYKIEDGRLIKTLGGDYTSIYTPSLENALKQLSEAKKKYQKIMEK
jgi:hypothetical protein